MENLKGYLCANPYASPRHSESHAPHDCYYSEHPHGTKTQTTPHDDDAIASTIATPQHSTTTHLTTSSDDSPSVNISTHTPPHTSNHEHHANASHHATNVSNACPSPLVSLCLNTFFISFNKCAKHFCFWAQTIPLYAPQKSVTKTPANAFLKNRNRTRTTAVNHIVRHILICKTPQPMYLAIDPPARLIRMQYGGCSCPLADLFIPEKQDPSQVMPEMNQAARCQRKMKLSMEDLHNFRNCDAGEVMQKGDEYHSSIADACVRHRIRNNRFDDFLAVRTIISVESMFGILDLFHNPETPPVTGENFPVFCQKWEKPSCLMCILKVMEHV